MLCNTPIEAINTTNAVPPLDMNGSGTPVGGILPVTTAILIKTWLAITVVIPVAIIKKSL